MKFVAIAGAIFLLLIGFGEANYKYLDRSAKEITASISPAEAAISGNQWQLANDQIGRAEAKWNKNKDYWAVVMEHQEIDNIDFSFARLKNYLNSKSPALSLGELAVLEKTLEHIPEKETLTFHNIM